MNLAACRPRLIAICLGLAAGVLTSCTPEPPPAPVSPPVVVAPLPKKKTVRPRVFGVPPPKPAPPSQPRDDAPEPARPDTAAGEHPSAPSADANGTPAVAQPHETKLPSELIGTDEQGIIAWLGQPSEKMGTGPGALWRYKTESCELDLAFFPEMVTGKMRTLQLQAKGLSNQPKSTQECLDEIIATNRK